jgi:hypothetical protein
MSERVRARKTEKGVVVFMRAYGTQPEILQPLWPRCSIPALMVILFFSLHTCPTTRHNPSLVQSSLI